MLECKPISMLMETDAKICAKGGKDLEDPTMFKEIGGKFDSPDTEMT